MPLVRLSAKRTFYLLRNKSPLFCKEIGSKIHVSKMFFRHISFSKTRPVREIIDRLLIIPFIEEILTNGKISEQRTIHDINYFKISLRIKDFIFSVIFSKKILSDEHILVSCFIDQQENKKDLS